MIDFRPIAFILGILLSIVAIAMTLPAVVDAASGHPDWQVFAASALLTLFVGVAMMLTSRSSWHGFSLRQAFIMTNLAWLVTAGFGALPLAFAELEMSFTDAFFESMSGVTTTGSTVIVGLDLAPPGILLWRGILQWLGGIGIIVMAVSILPVLQVGGMQLFRVEAFETDKVLPRAAQIAGGIAIVYVFLTGLSAIVLWALGMTGFEAIVHAMTAIATGGFSTSDASIGHFASPAIDWTISAIMVIGSMPFVLYLRVIRGDPRALFKDSQVQLMLSIIGVSVGLCTVWLWMGKGEDLTALESLTYATFNVISVMTGTGYATDDYSQWGGFGMAILFALTFVGGCAASTSCGIKMFRFLVLFATARTQLLRLMQPNGVFIPYFNKRPIPNSVEESVMSFFFLFITSFVLLSIALGLTGLDFITAISGAATAISNVGPGLGEIIGPAGNFSTLPDTAKWLLAFGMLLGRLELFTVLVLLSRTFWRG